MLKNWLLRTLNRSRKTARLEARRTNRTRFLSGFESLENRRVLAVNPLLIDIAGAPRDANPTSLADVNGIVYFAADDGVSGVELWKTDGTVGGTSMVKDIQPSPGVSSNPSELTNVNGTLYFAAIDPGTGSYELWKSNGTAAGTVVVDGKFGSTQPSKLTNVNGTLFFTARRQNSLGGDSGIELWKSNGTAAGTVLVKDIVRGTSGSYPTKLTNVNGTLFFTATTNANGTELWKSNGTAAGTLIVRDIAPAAVSSSPDLLTAVNNDLYFTATNNLHGVELWKSNGSPAGTVMVKDITVGSGTTNPTHLVNLNGTLMFQALGELWKSDGSLGGTVPVEVVNTGSYSPTNLTNVNGTLFYTALFNGQHELWKSDGSPGGTVQVHDIDGANLSSYPTRLTNVNGTLYFTADSLAPDLTPIGRELWTSNGTSPGTALVKDILPGNTFSSNPQHLTSANGKLFFVATNAANGRELWSSSGTDATTNIVKDILALNSSSNPFGFTPVSSSLYFFTAIDPATGSRKLWKSDGTIAGTSLVEGPVASTEPSNLTNVDGTLFFTANDGINGVELWKSNGTPAGTVIVRNINAAGNGSYPTNLTNVGGTLYFSATSGTTGYELWKSNGTLVGTVLVANINTAANTGSSPANLTDVGGALYFTADNGVNGRELWTSNGLPGGTTMVKDINGSGDPSDISNLTSFNGALYFSAADSPATGKELWKSTGTLAGTAIVKNIATGSYVSSLPQELTVVGSTLFFSALDESNVRNLWKTDGTPAGTLLVDAIDGVVNNPTELTNVNGVLYFRAFDELGSSGFELWKSNGTVAGTTLVSDITPGHEDSNLESLTVVGSNLLFTVDMPGTGRELWKSNGTAEGTGPVTDLWPGPQSSDPTDLIAFNSKLVFNANNGLSGDEMFVLGANQAPVNTVPASPVAAFEDTPLTILGLAISDVDADTGVMSVTLTVANGVLTANTGVGGGVDAANVSNNGSASIVLNGTMAAINTTFANVSGVVYNPNPNFFGSDILTMTTNDHGNTGLDSALTAISNISISIAGVNDPPVLGLSNTPASYTENSAAIVLDGSSSAADIDSANFDTGTLTVTLGGTAAPGDELAIRNEGAGAGQIGVAANTVNYGGVAIGTFAGGVNGAVLAVTLNGAATPEATQALVRNITYRVVGDAPSELQRSVQFLLTDGDGGTSAAVSVAVNVTGVNDSPLITLPAATAVYVEDGAAVVLDSTATVSDPDSLNLDTGILSVQLILNGTANDRLEIRSQGFATGQIGVSESFIMFGTPTGPIVIGTFTGGVLPNALQITLNGNATPASVQALVRNLTFRTIGDSPTTTPRSVTIELTDGDGGTSAAVTKTVSVTAINDAPVMANLGVTVNYNENAAAISVSGLMTVTDPDSANFDTGKLTVNIIANGVATDRLGIRNQGTGVGQINLVGTSVRYGVTTIGTFAGGIHPAALVVTLNSNATVPAVQALAQNITFRVISEAPATVARTVQFVAQDGDGGTSAAVTKTVNVAAVNDRPVMGGVGGAVTYTENAAPLVVSTSATVTDVDSLDLGTGNLTVSLTAAGTVDDRLDVRHQGFSAGQIGRAGTSVLFGGLTIGSVAGGVGVAPLVVTLNTSATPASVQALARNVTFRVVGENPATAPRTVRYVVNDGDGGVSTSLPVSKVVSVTAVNDAPVVALPGATQTFTEGSGAVDIDSSASITDADSADCAGGVLTVSLIANGTSDDFLEIRHQGIAAGEIGVSGNNLTFGGILIGSFSGGAGTIPLSVNLTANATLSAVQALVRKITFRVQGTDLLTDPRSVQFLLTDGDGGTSAAITKVINVVDLP